MSFTRIVLNTVKWVGGIGVGLLLLAGTLVFFARLIGGPQG